MDACRIDELAQRVGMAKARVVGRYRQGKTIDGKAIKTKDTDEGRVWWLEGADEEESAEKKSAEDESAEEASDEGASTEEHGPSESEITVEWLTGVNGIGKKGAEKIATKLDGWAVRTFEIFNQFEDLTVFPGVGEKNGKALRKAIVAELDSEVADATEADDGAPEPEGTSPLEAERAELLEAINGSIDAIADGADRKRAKEIAADRIEDGVHDGQIRADNIDLDVVAANAATYCRALAVQEKIDAGVEVFKIHCPHCEGLYDVAPLGTYGPGRAECEADGDPGRGDCGEAFFIEEVDGAYQTRPVDEGGQAEQTDSENDAETVEAEDEEILADGGERISPNSPEEVGFNDEAMAVPAKEDEPKPNPFGVPPKTKASKPKHNPFAAPKKSKPAPKKGLVPHDERHHPALADCRVLGKAEHGTDAWHELRAKGIGSSDAGAILGLSPHATAVDVWKTKIGEEADNKPWLEEYADFGSWFEPYLREWCEAEHNIEILDGADIGVLQSARWQYALANIDGLDVTGGVVEEYKTTTEKWKTIPAHYEAQCHEQMLVTGAPEVRLRQFVCPIPRDHVPSLLQRMQMLDPSAADRMLADWLLERGEVHTWIVERDEKYIERMLERFKKFWGFVEMEVEPAEADPEGTVDLTDEAEVYAACNEYVRLNAKYEAQLAGFLDAEGLEVSSRGSIGGTAEEAIKSAKKKVRKAIEKAVALMCDDEERPKRVSIGDHHATYIDKGSYGYWRIYTKEATDVIDF